MALVGSAARGRGRRGPDGLGRDRQELERIPLAACVARSAPRMDRPLGARRVRDVRDPGRVVAAGAGGGGPPAPLPPRGPPLGPRPSWAPHPPPSLEGGGGRGPRPAGG